MQKRINVGFDSIKPLIEAEKWQEAHAAVVNRLKQYEGNDFLLCLKANLEERMRKCGLMPQVEETLEAQVRVLRERISALEAEVKALRQNVQGQAMQWEGR